MFSEYNISTLLSETDVMIPPAVSHNSGSTISPTVRYNSGFSYICNDPDLEEIADEVVDVFLRMIKRINIIAQDEQYPLRKKLLQRKMFLKFIDEYKYVMDKIEIV